MRTTSRMIAALTFAFGTLALGASEVVAQAPSAGGEGGTGTAAPASPAPAPVSPAAPAVPAPAPGAAPQQGTPATVLDTQDYESLLGRSVRSAGGDELGRVIDIVVDKEGHPRAAIIDFGGFLGVGTRKIAVDWRALRFTTEGKEWRMSVALTRNQVRVSPEYKSGEPIVVLGPGSSAGAPSEAEQTGAAAQGAPQTPAAAQPPSGTPAGSQPPVQAPAATPSPAPVAPSAPEKAQDK